MATIQIRRQLKFAHPKAEAINYIKTRLTMVPGEPMLCTYKNPDGKWGAIEVICIYPKGTHKDNTLWINHNDSINGRPISEYFGDDNKLLFNYIKINDDIPEWEKI